MKSRIVISVLAFFMAMSSFLFCMKDLEFFEKGKQPTAVCFSADGKHLVVGHKNGVLTLFEKNEKEVNYITLTSKKSEIKKVLFWENGETVIIVSISDAEVAFWKGDRGLWGYYDAFHFNKDELSSVAINNEFLKIIDKMHIITVDSIEKIGSNFGKKTNTYFFSTPLFADFQPLDKGEKIGMGLVGDNGSIVLYSSKKIIIWDFVKGVNDIDCAWEKAYCHTLPENTVIKSIAFSPKRNKIAYIGGCGQVTILQKNKKIWDVAALNIDPRFNEKFITFDSSGKKLISISDSLPNNVRLWQLIETKNGIHVQFVNTLTNYGLQACIHTIALNLQENLIAMCEANTVKFKKISLDIDKQPLFSKFQKEELYTKKGSDDSAEKKMPTFGDIKILIKK